MCRLLLFSVKLAVGHFQVKVRLRIPKIYESNILPKTADTKVTRVSFDSHFQLLGCPIARFAFAQFIVLLFSRGFVKTALGDFPWASIPRYRLFVSQDGRLPVCQFPNRMSLGLTPLK